MNNRQLKKQLKKEKTKVRQLIRLSEILIRALRYNASATGLFSTYRVAEAAQKKLNEIIGEKSG
ncbi:MAG: hypothetical protein IKJ27_00170 [Clostridia bacterium]|nr:hypothetical protein [Clostridia bacterium]